MGKVVVCKVVRLGKDGDKFKKGLVAKVLRNNAKLDEDYVKEQNESWKTSGVYHEVDLKATSERNEKLEKSSEPSDAEKKAIREEAKTEAASLGIEYSASISTANLLKKIEEKKVM